MSATEQLAFGLAVAYAGGWLVLIFLISKLYEWNFPAPFWRLTERAWDQIVRIVDKGLTAILRTIARAVRA